ncbi:MAG: DNA polymerase III subunit alpha [Clostridiales bacterium]|nr:DNA polymerase III subunit alpha [Clostridiales bacterium]
MTFVHLHNHTEYSLLDGAARLEPILRKAVDLGMPALALTDHGVMYGVINFYKKALELGVKPIIGCEVYVAPRSRFEREPGREDSSYHLVLLAENNEGYKNLCRLVSCAYLEGFYYKPRVDKELLRRHSQGLIALSACVAGEVPSAILRGDREAATRLILEYSEIFGPGNFFLELQDHGMEEQRLVNEALIEFSRELALPLVATNDIHYVRREDANVHDILLCIQTGKIRSDEKRMRFPNDEFYLKSEAEMRRLFANAPEAVDNSGLIAERCNVELEFGKLYLPDYEAPPGHDLDSYLAALCREGLERRYELIGPELQERLAYELEIIRNTGFSGYFLIVWDLVKFAHENDVLVGPGRGSAAGSLVAYALGITNIDPLRYGLLFERFLNPERVSPPDIDIDFCYENRGKVIEYLVNRYGANRVGQIITFGTMKAKGAVRDVGRVLNIPLGEVDKVAKLIPETLGVTLEDALKNSHELRAVYEETPAIKEVIDIARKIEGMPRHSSTHAAGVVIARQELVSYLPVEKTKEGFILTQFEKQEVEESGLLKMDILGLRTLTVIGDAVENVRKSRGIEIDTNSIPLDDAKTFAMLTAGESVCVFQLESDGMREIMKNLRPERFEDIIALVALYRPGPLEGGMVDYFIKSKHGEKAISYKHPLLEPILKETYGVIVYQEQVMQIASALAGFSLGQSDMLRRAMGKKKPEIIAKERDHFVEGAAARNVGRKTAGDIFDLMEKFAGYGFNKSHSAAYALVAYQTAWLKANYAPEFMAAMLTAVMDNTDKVQYYLDECTRLGIAILPPDVNESGQKFSVAGGNIRFGLAAVKNVGREAVGTLIREREENGAYSSLGGLCCRIQPNRKMLESLIKCGALDCLGHSRAQMLAATDRALELGRKLAQDKNSPQQSLFDFGMGGSRSTQENMVMPDIPEFSFSERLAMEREMIGFYVSGHPLDAYVKLFKNKISHTVKQLADCPDEARVKVGGAVSDMRKLITKKGDSMATFSIEDKEGALRCVIFPKAYLKFQDILQDDRVLLLEGSLSLKESAPKLIAENLALPGKLYLRLPDSGDAAMLVRVRERLLAQPGYLPVLVYYEDLQHDDLRQYRPLPGVTGISPDEKLLSALSGFLGEKNVVLR